MSEEEVRRLLNQEEEENGVYSEIRETRPLGSGVLCVIKSDSIPFQSDGEEISYVGHYDDRDHYVHFGMNENPDGRYAAYVLTRSVIGEFIPDEVTGLIWFGDDAPDRHVVAQLQEHQVEIKLEGASRWLWRAAELLREIPDGVSLPDHMLADIACFNRRLAT